MADNILTGAAGGVESATTLSKAAPRLVEVAFVQLRQEDCQRPKGRGPGSFYSRSAQWLIERQERLLTRREELARRHRRSGHTCRRALPADHSNVEPSAQTCPSASADSGEPPLRLSQHGSACSSGTVDAGVRLHNEAQERMVRRHERTEAYFRKICRCPCTPNRSTAVLRRSFERRALQFATGGKVTFENLQALCRDIFHVSDSASAMAAAAVWDVDVDHSFIDEAQSEVEFHTDGRTEVEVDVEQRWMMENEEPHEAGESQTDRQVCIPESNSDDVMPVAQPAEACPVHDRGTHASVSTCIVQEREVVEGEVGTKSRQVGSLSSFPETRPLKVVIERLLHIRSSPYLLYGDAAAREKRKCAAAATAEATCHGLSCWKQPAEGTRWLQRWGKRQAMKVFEILRSPGGMSRPAWHTAVGVLATAAGLKVDVRTLAEETWACILTGQGGRGAELTAPSFATTVLPAVTHALSPTTKPDGDLQLVTSNDSTAAIDTIARAIIDVVSRAGLRRLEEELAKARPLPLTRSPPPPPPMSNSERRQRRQRQMEQLKKFEDWHGVVREEKDARAAEARAARLRDEMAECTFAPRVRPSEVKSSSCRSVRRRSTAPQKAVEE